MRWHRLGVVPSLGWLLLAPPFPRDTAVPDPSLPIDQWEVEGKYADRPACEKALEQLVRNRSDAINAYDFDIPHIPPTIRAAAEQAEHLRCVPTDSPKTRDGRTKHD